MLDRLRDLLPRRAGFRTSTAIIPISICRGGPQASRAGLPRRPHVALGVDLPLFFAPASAGAGEERYAGLAAPVGPGRCEAVPVSEGRCNLTSRCASPTATTFEPK